MISQNNMYRKTRNKSRSRSSALVLIPTYKQSNRYGYEKGLQGSSESENTPQDMYGGSDYTYLNRAMLNFFFFANNSFQPTFPQTFEPHASMDPRACMFALQMQEMQQMLHWQAMARYNAWLRQLQAGDRTWAIPHAQPHQGVGSYQKKISLSANDNVRQ